MIAAEPKTVDVPVAGGVILTAESADRSVIFFKPGLDWSACAKARGLIGIARFRLARLAFVDMPPILASARAIMPISARTRPRAVCQIDRCGVRFSAFCGSVFLAFR